MEQEIIKSPSGKILARVYLFLDLLKKYSYNNILEFLGEEIPFVEGVGYAGFTEKEYLINKCLKGNLFSKKKNVNAEEVSKAQILEVVKKSLNKIERILDGEVLNIFIFPSFDPFIKDKMMGNFGYTPWKNTIHLYVNYLDEEKLGHTLIHETAHALSLYTTKENAIGASLLYEGIAEKFREEFLGGEKSPWVKVLSPDKIREILESLELKETNFELYSKLFSESEEYPLWSGYAIGYHMAEKFLKKLDKIDWSKIIRLDMNEQVFEESEI